MSETIENRWLSVDEIATYLGVKRDTVYKWIERKNMPAHKVGRLWKFKVKEVDGWVRQGEIGRGGNEKGVSNGTGRTQEKPDGND